MVRPLTAAAYSIGARNLVPIVFQKRCSGRCSSVGVCSMALASITAICCAPAQVPHVASGVHCATTSPEAPSGSMMVTSPLRARCAIVARSTSGLTLVASRGPCQSRMPGTRRPVVLKLPVGPKTSTEWQSSLASSRPPLARPASRLVRPTITRPGVGRRTNSRRSSRPPAHTDPLRCRRVCSRPGRCPGARPGRYCVASRTTNVMAPAIPPTSSAAEK